MVRRTGARRRWQVARDDGLRPDHERISISRRSTRLPRVTRSGRRFCRRARRHRLRTGDGLERALGETRKCPGGPSCPDPGAQPQLWWVDVATKLAVPLSNLNGVGYLPVESEAGHADDTVFNYEPTVNPMPSGGYVWVVFTSRRLYGNIATIDPIGATALLDLTVSPTPKKLWVAAIDLNAPRGDRPQSPGLLSAGARAARGQFARLLGGGRVRPERFQLSDGRPMLRRLLQRRRRRSRLQQPGLPPAPRNTTNAPKRATAAVRQRECSASAAGARSPAPRPRRTVIR